MPVVVMNEPTKDPVFKNLIGELNVLLRERNSMSSVKPRSVSATMRVKRANEITQGLARLYNGGYELTTHKAFEMKHRQSGRRCLCLSGE